MGEKRQKKRKKKGLDLPLAQIAFVFVSVPLQFVSHLDKVALTVDCASFVDVVWWAYGATIVNMIDRQTDTLSSSTTWGPQAAGQSVLWLDKALDKKNGN